MMRAALLLALTLAASGCGARTEIDLTPSVLDGSSAQTSSPTPGGSMTGTWTGSATATQTYPGSPASSGVATSPGPDVGMLDAGPALAQGLVAYYPFDGNALDYSGNSNDCTVIGATLTADRFGRANSAYSFGGNAYMDCGDGPTIRITGDLTLTAWLEAAPSSLSGDNRTVVERWSFDAPEGESFALGIQNQDQTGIGLCAPTNGPLFTVKMVGTTSDLGTAVCGPSPVSTSTWHHIAGVYVAGTELRAYLDGQPVADDTQGVATSIFNGTAHLTIGVNEEPDDNAYFIGVLDEIRVYSRALDDAEIFSLYIDPASPIDAGSADSGFTDAGLITDSAPE